MIQGYRSSKRDSVYVGENMDVGCILTRPQAGVLMVIVSRK